jgi:hypothetical protein
MPTRGVASPLSLATPDTFDPRLLVRERSDDWGKLFLALALVYNDLKFFATSLWWLDERKPDLTVVDELAGEYRGIALQGHRFIAGVLNELMVLIQAKRTLVESTTFANLMRGVGPTARAAWDALVAVALGRDEPAKKMQRTLARIRNKVAFHYFDPEDLALGFERHFARAAEGRPYDKAWWSPGESMERTRFHFADAAAEGALARASGEPVPQWEARAGKVAQDVNVALRHVVERFIQARKQSGGQAP